MSRSDDWGRTSGDRARELAARDQVWARRDQQAGQGGGGGSNRNNDKGTCICMLIVAIGGIADVAWHALQSVLDLSPGQFL